MANTVGRIAKHIAGRGKAMGWKPGTKTADKANIELWIGAWIGLMEAGHEDAEWVGRVTTMVISVRGYRETLLMADKADESPI